MLVSKVLSKMWVRGKNRVQPEEAPNEAKLIMTVSDLTHTEKNKYPCIQTDINE